jgi:hypothetical protein
MLRSRLIFDPLTNFPRSATPAVPLVRKIRQAIKSLTDLTHQPVHFPG